MGEAVQTSASTTSIWVICVVGVAVLTFWLIAVVVADARQNQLSRRNRLRALPGPFHGTGPVAEVMPGTETSEAVPPASPALSAAGAGAVPRARIPEEAVPRARGPEEAVPPAATTATATGTATGRHARPVADQGPEVPARPDLPNQRQAPGRHEKPAAKRESGQATEGSAIAIPRQRNGSGTPATPTTPRQRNGESGRATRSRSGGGSAEGNEPGQK